MQESHGSWGFYDVKVTKLGLQPLLNLLISSVQVFSFVNIFELLNKNLTYTNIYCNSGPFSCAGFPYTLSQPTPVAK